MTSVTQHSRPNNVNLNKNVTHIHFFTHSGQILFRGCAGEEVSGGKTDAGVEQQVRGNWIPSMLHTTCSRTRLTVVHAKDAQTLAKVFLQRSDIGMHLVYMSLSASDMQSTSTAVLLCWSGTWEHFCTTPVSAILHVISEPTWTYSSLSSYWNFFGSVVIVTGPISAEKHRKKHRLKSAFDE